MRLREEKSVKKTINDTLYLIS